MSFRSDALASLSRQWDLEPGSLPIRWILSDRIRGEGIEAKDRVRGVTRVEADRIEVEIDVAFFASRPRKMEAVIKHELTHALLASRIGRDKYFALPTWFREGHALSVAGEGSERVAAAAVRSLIERKWKLPIGLAAGPLVTPAEGYLAIVALDRFDAGVSKRLLSALASGKSWRSSVEAVFAKPYDRAIEAWSASIPPVLAAELESLPEFRRALDALGEESFEDAARAFAKIDRGALRSPSRYFRAKALFALENYGAALRVIASTLDSPLESSWESQALALGARCHAEMGEAPKALTFARECLDRFPEDKRSAKICETIVAKCEALGADKKSSRRESRVGPRSLKHTDTE